MEPTTKRAVLLGTRGEPEVDMWFGYHDLHPLTNVPLREWVKALPNRRWNPAAKSWRVGLKSLPKGTLRDAGFTVTFLDGAPAKPSDLSELPRDRAREDLAVPAWFGLALDPYQRVGAERVAAGRFLLADTPGLGKTRQLLAVAAVLAPGRVLILCPPVVLTHWLRETEQSGLVGHVDSPASSEAPGAILAPPTTRWPSTSGDGPSMSDPPPACAERLRAGEIVVIRPGRKEPELPDGGVVIVPDTLVAARRKLLARLWAWQPELLIYDEAHRAKTWDSKRSVAARTIAGGTVGPVLVSTGTPMFAQPAEMVPLLDMTGQLGPVFGGRAAFVDRYLRLNRYRQLVARPERLPELRAKLDREVWVRRTKADVLRDLPPKSRRALVVDVDRSGFDAAHAEVAAAASRWLADYHAAVQALPSEEEILEWCRGNLAFVSSLRRAAGLCKVSGGRRVHLRLGASQHRGGPRDGCAPMRAAAGGVDPPPGGDRGDGQHGPSGAGESRAGPRRA